VAPRIERNLPPPYWKEAERANRAATNLDAFGDASFPFGYPGWLANRARAIAVFPSVKKAAFVIGARWGQGLFSMRDENGCWLPPSYVNIGGGSFGFQAGFQASDIVLIFTNDNAVSALLTSKLTLNGTAQAAGGPWGRDAQAGIDWMLRAPILAFSRSRGAFVGVSLDGSVLTIDDSSNQDVYGMHVTGTDILRLRRVDSNDVVAPFMTSLAQVSPGSRQASASTSAPTN
jgi:lipid-binding SYLF domain-containing protein